MIPFILLDDFPFHIFQRENRHNLEKTGKNHNENTERQNTWFMRAAEKRNVAINLVLWKLSQSFRASQHQWTICSTNTYMNRETQFIFNFLQQRAFKNQSEIRSEKNERKKYWLNWVSNFFSCLFAWRCDFLRLNDNYLGLKKMRELRTWSIHFYIFYDSAGFLHLISTFFWLLH